MGGLFSSPSIPPPPPPAPAADLTPSDTELRRLAQQREELDKRRRGRSSFVIPLTTSVSGIRIPDASE